MNQNSPQLQLHRVNDECKENWIMVEILPTMCKALNIQSIRIYATWRCRCCLNDLHSDTRRCWLLCWSPVTPGTTNVYQIVPRPWVPQINLVFIVRVNYGSNFLKECRSVTDGWSSGLKHVVSVVTIYGLRLKSKISIYFWGKYVSCSRVIGSAGFFCNKWNILEIL